MELVSSRDEFAFFYTPSLLSPLSSFLSSFMELVSSRDEFAFFFTVTLSPLSYLLSLTLSPLSSLLFPLFSHPLSSLLSPLSSFLSPMWQKLPYICNNFCQYSNLSITFLNCCTIEKSPVLGIPLSRTAFIGKVALCHQLELLMLWTHDLHYQPFLVQTKLMKTIRT